MHRFITISAFTLLLAGCPGPRDTPLSGPGFDEDTGGFVGEDGDYFVALTYLKVRNAPGPGDRFGELANAAGTSLYEDEPAGWLGAGFYAETRLKQYTMTVWESEEAMLDWVVGPVHAEAMVAIGDVSSEAKKTLLAVTEAELPLQWEDALPLYEALPWYQHPNLRSE